MNKILGEHSLAPVSVTEQPHLLVAAKGPFKTVLSGMIGIEKPTQQEA